MPAMIAVLKGVGSQGVMTNKRSNGPALMPPEYDSAKKMRIKVAVQQGVTNIVPEVT